MNAAKRPITTSDSPQALFSSSSKQSSSSSLAPSLTVDTAKAAFASRPGYRPKRAAHQGVRQAIVFESSVKLTVNLLLAIVATTTIAKLVPYYQAHQQRLTTLQDAVAVAEHKNAELRSQFTTLGQPYCYALLQQVDSAAAERIHPHDQVRTLRSLEVFYVTGHTISSQQGEQPPSYPILYIGLACDVEKLRSRITTRTHDMIAAGFAAEVAGLIEQYGPDLPLLKTLGYAEMQQHLAGEITLENALALTVQRTCQFAKRQRTWFRKEPRIEWFEADDPDLIAQVIARVEKFTHQLQVSA